MFGKRKHARILMSRRNAAAYVDGRYLHVDAKLSVKSKRDREIARDLAESIIEEVGASEGAFTRRNSPPTVSDIPDPVTGLVSGVPKGD